MFYPKDLLIKFSTVFRIEFDSGTVITEVQKQVRKPAEKMEFDMVPDN